jgi:uncharacterized protein YndB with AHSA1/START domain
MDHVGSPPLGRSDPEPGTARCCDERETSVTHDLRIERLLDASPTELFDAFVDPEAMRDWWRIDATWEVHIGEADVRVGGATSLTFGSPGNICAEVMSYTEVDRPHRLRFADEFIAPDGSRTHTEVTITFKAIGAKTLMTIVQTGFPTAERRDRHETGWPRFLDRLHRGTTERLQ